MRHCEECGAVLDPAKVLRCTKCKACFYCSRTCQTRNWKHIHKRVCSTDPLLRPFIRVEMAVERVLAKLPPMEQAPQDAFCYICLEGDGASASSKLMRGCACRGDSAGFVHLECLTELAMSKDESGDFHAIFNGWLQCGNCKQNFQGALDLEMKRRFWRRYRSTQNIILRYNSTRNLASILGDNREFDSASQLLDEASTCVGNQKEPLLDLKFLRADLLKRNGQMLEALGLLQAMLPEAKGDAVNPCQYYNALKGIVDVLLGLHRNQEAHEAAAEAGAFTKAKFGFEHPMTLEARKLYALACAKLGRIEEAKASFEDALTTQIRVLGRDHPATEHTRQYMRTYGFA